MALDLFDMSTSPFQLNHFIASRSIDNKSCSRWDLALLERIGCLGYRCTTQGPKIGAGKFASMATIVSRINKDATSLHGIGFQKRLVAWKFHIMTA
jgi:hypothetical protein